MKFFFFKIIRNIYFLLFTKKKFLFIFNYHQIYKNEKKEVIMQLHKVKYCNFISQIKIMSILGSFISLNDVISHKLKSKINFLITFDDVPESFQNISQFLINKSIPVLLCPSFEITENGYGWRNKVYKIIDILDPKKISKEIDKLDVKYNFDEKKSFYKFTKCNSKNSLYMENKIINPLFNKIYRNNKNVFAKRSYLNWEYYKNNNFEKKNIEIANHSLNHHNMSTLSRDQIFNDFKTSDKKIKDKLKINLRCFAVPFGSVTNNLLIDLTDIAVNQKYNVILWITNSANIIYGKKNNQIHQLSRIHTPDSLFIFIKILLTSFLKANHNILDFSKENNDSISNLELCESNSAQKSISIENLLRPNKDFASDPIYFDYLYSKNIFRGKRPHYFYMSSNERIKSILYNFHAEFNLDGKKYKGVYWAGGRSLPFKKNISNASLFLKSMQEEVIIGSYKPNKYFQKGLRNWKKIPMFEVVFPPKIKKNHNSKKNFIIKKNLKSTKKLDKILQINEEKTFFSLSKSSKYYSWRYDEYCYADTVYYILYKNGKPSSFLLLQSKDDKASISDFSFFSLNELEYLIVEVINDLNRNKISKVCVETSKNDILNIFRSFYNVKIKNFFIYYYFNKKYFKNKIKDLDKKFNEYNLNETQTSGDVLLR